MTGPSALPPERPARRRGRPSVVDPAALSEVALTVFLEKGYAATTWADIAAVAGISLRSLSRHFSSKSELALIGIAPGWQDFARILQEASGDDLEAVLRTSIYTGVQALSDAGSAGTNWVRLVAREPKLVAEIRSATAPWVRAMREKIAEIRPDLSPAACQALAGAYDAAVFAALEEWALDEIGTPSDAIERLLDRLEFRVKDDPSTSR